MCGSPPIKPMQLAARSFDKEGHWVVSLAGSVTRLHEGSSCRPGPRRGELEIEVLRDAVEVAPIIGD